MGAFDPHVRRFVHKWHSNFITVKYLSWALGQVIDFHGVFQLIEILAIDLWIICNSPGIGQRLSLDEFCGGVPPALAHFHMGITSLGNLLSNCQNISA